MLKDIVWAENRKYRNLTKNEPFDFYIKALTNSINFDLLLGYFSSSAIKVLSIGFARFLQNGGDLRIVANNILSEEDAKLISETELFIEEDFLIDLNDFHGLKNKLNGYGRHFFECLAYLIVEKRIQIILIKPKNKNGIAHFKEGYFYDGFNAITFSGSCNFTKNALVSNLEGFTISLDWDLGPSKIQVQEQKVFFDNIFSGNSDLVDIVGASEIEIAIRDEFSGKDLNDLIVDGIELENEYKMFIGRESLIDTIDYINLLQSKIQKESKKPLFPYANPFEYQIEAYNKWCENGYSGLFAMATGTGKTLTSLYCLIEDYKKCKIQKNIIVVPGKELVEQWNIEMLNCCFLSPIKWYSGNNKLKRDISYIKLCLNSEVENLNIIITYDSFISNKFLTLLGSRLKDFTIIFDEAHNMGAAKFMESLNGLSFNKRIGLSATPLRLWDENNENVFIETFFNSPFPYTYSYSMEEAIKNGFLCKYKYDPYFVTFTDEEWIEYLDLTKRIPIAKDGINTPAALKRQLLKDQAENKNNAVIDIVQKLILSNSFKNTLIYCPKGADDINDERYINILKIRLKTNFPQLNIEIFVSETADRDLLLNDFESEDVHMLLAIKCLDEGVNIPKTMNAIFVASGQNYREFVQRRGRVLRNYTDGDFKKEFASIFDIVILPTISQFTNHKNTAQKLIISEFARLYEFNDLAIPSLTTLQKINSNLENYGLTEGYIRQMVENNELNKI